MSTAGIVVLAVLGVLLLMAVCFYVGVKLTVKWFVEDVPNSLTGRNQR